MSKFTWAKLPKWIVLDGTLATLSPTEIKVLMILITLTDQHGFVSPSHSQMAELGGMDARSVRRATKSLRESGTIQEVQPAVGRQPAQYHIQTGNRQDTITLSKGFLDRAPKPCLHKVRQNDRDTMSCLQLLDRTPLPCLSTYIGTRVRRIERESKYISLSLSDFTIQLFRDTFPAGLIKTSWSEANFTNIATKLNSLKLMTHWQAIRFIESLAGVQNRKFAVPGFSEVSEGITAIETANRKREQVAENDMTKSRVVENLEQYLAITRPMNDDQLLEIFEIVRDEAIRTAPRAAKHIWDFGVDEIYRNAYRDILVDPECEQFVARALRKWVITVFQKGNQK